MEFPRMLYRCPGAESIHGGNFSTLVVVDEAEQAAALADGWHLTTPEAAAAHEAAKAEALAAATPVPVDDPKDDDTRAPSREELEQMADKLGIQYGPRVSDKKLRALIDEATKAGA